MYTVLSVLVYTVLSVLVYTWGYSVHCTLRASVHSRSFLVLNFPLYKQEYLRNPWSNKGLKSVVVIRTCHSMNGRSLEMMLTVPLKGVRRFDCKFSQRSRSWIACAGNLGFISFIKLKISYVAFFCQMVVIFTLLKLWGKWWNICILNMICF